MQNEGELYFEGKKYISSKRAAKLTGYTHDYIGQLSRAGKIDGKVIGKTRFVEEKSLLSYEKNNNGIKKNNNTYTKDSWESMLFGKVSDVIKNAGNSFKNKDISFERTNDKSTIYNEQPTTTTERKVSLKTSNIFAVKKDARTSKLSEEKQNEILEEIKAKKEKKNILENLSVSAQTPTPYKSLLPIIPTGELLRRAVVFAMIPANFLSALVLQ